MSAVQNSFDPKDFTQLPVSIHMKLGSAGGVVRVITPHKGEVLLDWQYNGLLSVHETLATAMIEDIRALEAEAREHLFQQWRKLQTD